ncbi:MAG: hypothetical protein SAJ12_21340 [Jaaginema sp. PMC 1079.18]|nr:hypothetical protein [Jaaginema sp. PMC 1080.18]MEC4853532.1 hypothetical protein [Jaaginema sp. PMC 1079.18]MEC4865076.1 hypothetical protein [Jaaginema sp. PMC 1078.18]
MLLAAILVSLLSLPGEQLEARWSPSTKTSPRLLIAQKAFWRKFEKKLVSEKQSQKPSKKRSRDSQNYAIAP